MSRSHGPVTFHAKPGGIEETSLHGISSVNSAGATATWVFFKTKSKPSVDFAFTQARGAESLDESALVDGLLRMIEGKPPIVPAICLIAYENVFLLKSLFERVVHGVPSCPPSLENIARWLEQQRTQFTSGSLEDETNSRRYFYFHIAVLLSIAHTRAKERPALWERLTDVWVALLPGAAALRRTLDTTQLWSPYETIFFDNVQTARDGEEYCVVHGMPSELRDHKKIWDWLWRDTPPALRAELEASIDATMGRTAK